MEPLTPEVTNSVTLPTLQNEATRGNFLVIAEATVLTTQCPPKPEKLSAGVYMKALANVHGWELQSKKNVFIIKAPDLARFVQIPRSAFSEETKLQLDKLGFSYSTFNNVIHVRVPNGFKMPKLKKPDHLRYNLKITQYDSQQLQDLGISVDVLAGVQNDNIKFLTRYTITDLLTGAIPSALPEAKYLNVLNSVKVSKLKKALKNYWTLTIDGNSISKSEWSEDQTKNVLLESRNVEDARVSVDRQEVKAGRSLSVEPLGANVYRVALEDLTVNDNLDVSGLKYNGDVNLARGHATWVYTGKIRTKKRGLFARGFEIRDQRYVVTLQVVKNPNVLAITAPMRHITPSIEPIKKAKKRGFLKRLFRKKKQVGPGPTLELREEKRG